MHIFKKFLKLFFFLSISLVIVITGLYSNAYLSKKISLNSIGTYELYDSNDDLIFQGNSKSAWSNIDEISTNLKNAVIAVEDKNFYKHNGFDYIRIVKAMLNNIKNRKLMQGASTISQQYIKNAYLEFDKTWKRKYKEALMTINLETHYSKDEILEAYLNTINYGNGNYGITNAAKYYFNKSAKDLNLEEAILLAGIPKNPTKYNPITNYDNAIKRAKIVAKAMYNCGYINKTEYSSLYKNKLTFASSKQINNLNTIMYYNDTVLNELKNIPGINENMINSGGLKIYTSLNVNTQAKLEEQINYYLDDDNIQVSSIIIDPTDGSISALIGGKNYLESQYNRAINSKRQVGSTMKPFLYYSAIANGMTSSSKFLSQKTTFNLENGKTYSPNNYANIYPNKEITMAAAIAYSDNIYAVKTDLFLGNEQLIKTAKLCGINGDLKNYPSLALGTSELSLYDFASGYTTFASGGYKRTLHTIRKILDKDGNVIYEYKNENNLVLNPNYVYILNEMLTSTTNSAFIDYNTPTAINIASKLTRKYALKTGTTDTDYLTVGYNKKSLMVMWTGYDNNDNIPLNLGTKSKNIWANTIEYINENLDDTWYEKPNNVVGVALDAIEGIPTEDSSKTNIFYYLKGSEPNYSN